MGAELFHADGRTDLTKLIIAVCNYANAPEKSYFIPQKQPIWPKLLDLQGQNCAVLSCPVQR
jgi:hypothetical protein